MLGYLLAMSLRLPQQPQPRWRWRVTAVVPLLFQLVLAKPSSNRKRLQVIPSPHRLTGRFESAIYSIHWSLFCVHRFHLHSFASFCWSSVKRLLNFHRTPNRESQDSMAINEPFQIIEGHNLDPQKLVNLLQSVYGTSNDGEHKFRVEVRSF